MQAASVQGISQDLELELVCEVVERRKKDKMKSFMVAVLLAVAVCAIHAAPVDEWSNLEQFTDEVNAAYGGDELQGVRQRRVTCDLLSYGGKVNHSACAANCLSMGKAGGRCNDGICQCRKTNFGDLWNKRFG